MRKRLLPIAFVGTLFVFLFNFSCTKLDTTSLGSDLIPVVDNINTFADTFDIVSTQFPYNDSVAVDSSEFHALGLLNNDPLFGTTDARIYVQMKPPFYPFYFGNSGDTIRPTGPVTNVGVDSMFLCLSFASVYGDTTIPQQLEVRQIFDNDFARYTTLLRNITYQPFAVGPSIGSSTVNISGLYNKIYLNGGKDSAVNQIRIKLDPAFVSTFYDRDSTKANLGNNAFLADSIFRQFYNGFEISATSTNSKSLLYANLAGPGSRLEVYYRKKNKGIFDTTYAVFPVYQTATSVAPSSATANYVKRFPSGGITNPMQNDIYLQTTPGDYANLHINSLDTLKNCIVHRAEILMEQSPDLADAHSDSVFAAPGYLYLDLKDSPAVANKWKPVYFDLNPSSPYDPDYKSGYPYYPVALTDPSYFGGIAKYKTDINGRRVAYYNFNVTRYLQQLVTRKKPNYDFRLFSPFSFRYPQYSTKYIPYYNNIGNGRVRLAGGANPDKNKKMRMVVIYSKIK